MPINAVAPQPAQASDGRARNRPIAFGFVTINIITTMMGAATNPLITAVQTSNRMGLMGKNPIANPITVAAEMIM